MTDRTAPGVPGSATVLVPEPATSGRLGGALAHRELDLLIAVHRHAGPRARSVATALSRAGEHAAAWIVVGGTGLVVQRGRRREWGEALAVVVAAHGASVVLKRVVRRVRPEHPGLVAHVAVPSRWTFPSSHATSTTAAAIAYAPLLGTRATAVLPPAMAWSRLALGVHYPSDVLSGAALGAALAAVARARAVRRG